MPEKVIIIGAGGHAKVVADVILSGGDEVAGFLDDFVTGSVMGLPVLGKVEDIDDFAAEYRFIIGIGSNEVRRRIARANSLRWHTAVHPRAVVADSAVIGEGSVVMAGAVVNPCAVVGRHCIVNTLADVEHDNVLGDFVHISPGAVLCGTVKVGELTHIGAGAVVKNNISVCGECTVGAGAAVVKDITVAGTYAGVPARLLKTKYRPV